MDDRIVVHDPDLMRRASRRMVAGFVAVMLASSPFTAGGFSLLRAGYLPGLPFAVGGAVVQAAAVTTVACVLAVRCTLRGTTVAGRAVSGTRVALSMARLVVLLSMAAVLVFAVVRAVSGDPWSLLTAVIISVALWFTAVGLRRTAASYIRP